MAKVVDYHLAPAVLVAERQVRQTAIQWNLKAMATLLVGFDSAWTPTNTGAIVGVLQSNDGTLDELGPPQIVDYNEAQAIIRPWQDEGTPTETLIMLDQPTIVKNAAGQRPVENLVSAPVGRRYGGVQPANTSRKEMFGEEAPVWAFLSAFGGAADPLQPPTATTVFETYPVLSMVALSWTLPDVRPTGRLPKYNPAGRTFSIADWQHVCNLASAEFEERGLRETAEWIGSVAGAKPRKTDQDCLDACICSLVAFHYAERKELLMVGDLQSGYIVVPYGAELSAELETRCRKTGRTPTQWVRSFRMAE